MAKADYPQIEFEAMIVDNACMQLVGSTTETNPLIMHYKFIKLNNVDCKQICSFLFRGGWKMFLRGRPRCKSEADIGF